MNTRYLIFPFFLLLTSCSLLQTETSETEMPERVRRKIENNASSVQVESKNTEDFNPETEYGLEIIWDIPEESVDGYVIYSGQSADSLDSELHVRISDLKILDDKEYSYTISPVDPEKPIFLAIAAKIGDTVSEKSEAKQYLPEPKFSSQE